MLPWFSWSLIACCVIWKIPLKTYVETAAFKMEMAFWFLFSLFTIDTIFTIAELLSARKHLKMWGKCFLFICVWGGENAALLMVGKIMGITFLGIKFSSYYSVFYLVGFILYHIKKWDKWKKIRNVNVQELRLFCTLGLYVYMITKYNLYNIPDSFFYVLIRFVISLSGCLTVYEIMDKLKNINQNKITSGLQALGKKSLELYVVQMFVVGFLKCDMYSILTITGTFFCLIYFGIVFFISLAIIWLLNQSILARKILFGK